MVCIRRINVDTAVILVFIARLFADSLFIERPVITIKGLYDARQLIIRNTGQEIASSGVELAIQEFRLVEVIIGWSSRIQGGYSIDIFIEVILIGSQALWIIRHIGRIGL